MLSFCSLLASPPIPLGYFRARPFFVNILFNLHIKKKNWGKGGKFG